MTETGGCTGVDSNVPLDTSTVASPAWVLASVASAFSEDESFGMSSHESGTSGYLDPIYSRRTSSKGELGGTPAFSWEILTLSM